MFWSIFFIGNSKAAVIDPFKNDLTLMFGYLIVAMFNITSITIFINMLIASMVRSYEVILVSTTRLNIFFFDSIGQIKKCVIFSSMHQTQNGNTLDLVYIWSF